MPIDQRDYYVERIRKETAYVEKSEFRMSLTELQRQKKVVKNKQPSWVFFWAIFALAVIFIALKIALMLLKR